MIKCSKCGKFKHFTYNQDGKSVCDECHEYDYPDEILICEECGCETKIMITTKKYLKVCEECYIGICKCK